MVTTRGEATEGWDRVIFVCYTKAESSLTGIFPLAPRPVVIVSHHLCSRQSGGIFIRAIHYFTRSNSHFSPASLRYSTVTLFAKLRGWSTSQPRRTAM